ncbi:L,D-transpeptidase family protein [Paracoccus sp. 1_MG-2023]|uniref:L,D-transpeptidase family protein n=1 Tax=unclassified Paracoccus (in: a-proteobacteria) TaxID=2688777 RepID=UPI001C09112A|nr:MULTISPECIES: L,D-transpeptidase family protein [unclassified Paracoccus (in: a-proteobacteria)]MBU2957040.1 L,D-transpeptidase family protein [Paracoccus sp. C2R09]MDO6668238.1 L,D-transpeptidase family protein [Paracoccus sp. 1_MG-2023]
MSKTTRRSFTLSALALLAACGKPQEPSKFQRYSGPAVTQINVNKGARKLYLVSGNTVVKSYDVSLGFAPVGHKQFEGDGRTPEGVYYIDRFNPRSAFHLSVGVSYPNAQDRAYAEAHGRSPGGDIFIHGRGPDGNNLFPRRRDWTAGCISVTDEEIEEIYAMVPPGIPIVISA